MDSFSRTGTLWKISIGNIPLKKVIKKFSSCLHVGGEGSEYSFQCASCKLQLQTTCNFVLFREYKIRNQFIPGKKIKCESENIVLNSRLIIGGGERGERFVHCTRTY